MNDKEEMIIVKDNPNLIVINQLPVISEQLDMVKAEIQRRTAFAEKSRLDDVYKTAIEKVIAPIQAVQDKYKDCVGLYTKANSQLKAKIDVIEDGLKLAKENSVKEYFEELVTAKNIDFISFEQLGLKITLSVSEKKLKEQVNNIVERVATDLKAIDIQEDKEEILVEYKKHLNVSEAVSTVAARHKAIQAEKERKIKQEEQRAKQKAAARAVAEAARQQAQVQSESDNEETVQAVKEPVQTKEQLAPPQVFKPKFSVAITTPAYKKLINNTLKDPQRANNFIANVSTVVANNPQLQECEASTILSAAFLADSLNLSMSPQLGYCYLVPYETALKDKYGKTMWMLDENGNHILDNNGKWKNHTVRYLSG